jgi:hypothetical protein
LHFSGLDSPETEALDAGEDLVGGFCPSERLGIVIDAVDVILDGLAEFLRGTMDAPPQLLLG